MEIFHVKDAIVRWHNIYAHGKLESLISYDIIGSTENPPGEGITIATYKDNKCLVFVWQGRYGMCGLAVLLTDIEGMKYAADAFERKEPNI